MQVEQTPYVPPTGGQMYYDDPDAFVTPVSTIPFHIPSPTPAFPRYRALSSHLDPGKAILAMISQRSDDRRGECSPLDENNEHVKSVLALLSPVKPDQPVEERPKVSSLDFGSPRSPRIKTIVETVVDSGEIDEGKEGKTRLDLKALLSHLPPDRPHTSFSSSESEHDGLKSDFSPRISGKRSKLVAKFSVGSEDAHERVN